MSSGLLSSLSRFTAPDLLTSTASGLPDLLEAERAGNKLYLALLREPQLRDLLLRTAATAQQEEDQASLCLLLPQSVTLDDVRITHELVETHLVHMQRPAARSEPRPFTSLNGLCGTCLADGSIMVHGRLRPVPEQGRAIGGSFWDQGRGRNGTVPQLESQILVLREATLPPSAKLPLRTPVDLLLISDPLFFPGCGWKLPLALRKCTHRFSRVAVTDLPLADLPQLLYEYQILARAWLEATSDEAEEDLAPPPPSEALQGQPPPASTDDASPVVDRGRGARSVLGGLLRSGGGVDGSTSSFGNGVGALRERMREWRTPERPLAQPEAASPSAAALLRNLLRSGEERLLGNGGEGAKPPERHHAGGPGADAYASLSEAAPEPRTPLAVPTASDPLRPGPDDAEDDVELNWREAEEPGDASREAEAASAGSLAGQLPAALGPAVPGGGKEPRRESSSTNAILISSASLMDVM